MGINVVFILILLLLSGLFSATETAFSSVNKIRLKNYAAKGDKRAEKALKISNEFDKALTTILVGNNIVNILSASIGTVLFTEWFGPSGVGISTAVMTVLVLIFGEVLPKSIAKENAEKFSLAIAGALSGLMWILTPVVWFFTWLKDIAVKLISPNASQEGYSEDELKYIIEESEEQGVLEEQESDLVKSALEFDETNVDDILVPRVKIVAAEIHDDIDKIRELFITERYSRLPIYEDSVDSIVGIIHEKDFFKLLLDGGTDIKPIIQKAVYISDMKPISEVMRELQRAKVHMAVVVDQYGGTKGIVTLEDIIEELVGEIYDENDEADTSLVKISENSYEVSAEVSIHDMLQRLDMPEDLVKSEAVSVGGWVCELLGKIPEVGEQATDGIFTLTVLTANVQRAERLRVDISALEEPQE